MKLVRFGNPGSEKPGLIDDSGQIRDLSEHIADIGPETITQDVLDRLRKLDQASLPRAEGRPRLGPCVGQVPNFYCIGLNYSGHAAENGVAEPEEPIVFSKASSAISGPDDPVIIPPNSQKTDWEVELGIVIGQTCEYVSEAQALDYVAGYCVINDLSERAYQLEQGGQWIKGKSAPSFGPIGPWLVTKDEVPDPQNLNLWLKLNGEMMQNSNTSDMIFSVAEIISYLSRFMRLIPGDIIATGTPEGVGMGMKPQRFLQPADHLELSVEGLGHQHQTVEAKA